MRQIQIAGQMRLRFPGRGADFDEGVEIGMMATLMALGEREIQRTLSAKAVEQLRPLAETLRYRLTTCSDGDDVTVTLFSPAVRPKLRLVSSATG